jgi:phosphatidate cytidylyltransferase
MSPTAASHEPQPTNGHGRFGADVAIRTRSAIVLGLTVLALTIFGGWPFALFTAVLTALVFREWLFVTGCRRSIAVPGDLAVAAGAVVLLFTGSGIGWAFGGGAILMAIVVSVDAKLNRGAGPRIWAGIGVIYAVLPAIALQSLRESQTFGVWALVFLLAVVWSTDIAAFFAGRAIGGPRLIPRISPKKTWSGAAGGLCGALIAGGIVGFLANVPAVLPLLLLAGLTSVVCQAGDLFESWIKRCFLVKDSGQLIPGHGGVMDRVDGLIAAALFLAIVGWTRAGLNGAAAGLMIW